MIKIGTPLILELDNGEVERYRCKIVEQEGSILYVDYPINEMTGRTEIFPVETEFSASFVGQDNSVYRFNTEIKGKENINIPTLILDYPEEKLERIQRREYVRVLTSVDISVHDPEKILSPFTTITKDISGGGLSIAIPDGYQFRLGMFFDIWMVLPLETGDIEYVYCSSEVTRVHYGEDRKKNVLSLKFASIKDKDRQIIVRYCFERQLRFRKRGLTL